MKNNIFSIIAFFGLSALLLTGCASVPQAEIDAANAAIEEAKVAGAEVYVSENFIALQDSMNQIMVGIESEKSKFMKNYDSAKEQLAGITVLANEVKQSVEVRKEEIKVEVQNNVAETLKLVEANKGLILEAPKGKEGASALVAIKAEVDAIEASIAEANTLAETGDLIASLEKSKVIKDKAAAINLELTEVIAKFKSNVKGKK